MADRRKGGVGRRFEQQRGGGGPLRGDCHQQQSGGRGGRGSAQGMGHVQQAFGGLNVGGGFRGGRRGGDVGDPAPQQQQQRPQQQQSRGDGGRGDQNLPRIFDTVPQSRFWKRQNGLCSIFPIRVEPGRRAFRYDVEMENMTRQKMLTKSSNDGQRALNRLMCYDLLLSTFEETNRFGVGDCEIIYDNCTCLYTSVKIQDIKIDLKSGQVNDFVREHSKGAEFRVQITANREAPSLDLTDISQYKRHGALFEEDRSLRNFLEMLLSQVAINMNTYSMIGSGKLFAKSGSNNIIPFGQGISLRKGIAKGVRVVRSVDASGNAVGSFALVVDTTICPFYTEQNLSITVGELLPKNRSQPSVEDFGRIESKLKGIRLQVSYSKHRTFEFGRFSRKRLIDENRVEHDGRQISVPDYFDVKYGIKLANPHYPGVVPQNSKRGESFPIETLLVMADQRVSMERMSKQLSDHLLRVNSVTPQQRMNNIMEQTKALVIFDESNPLLNAFGVRVLRDGNQVAIGIRKPPQISYANNKIIQPNTDRANWRRNEMFSNYLCGGTLQNWIVMCKKRDLRTVDDFVHRFVEYARRSGFNVPPPTQVVKYNDGEAVHRLFDQWVTDNVQFVIYIDSRMDDNHHMLKLMEVRRRVITQHLTLERVLDVTRGKRQILENIINKTNCKNYGLNCAPLIDSCAVDLALERNETLIIGIDIAHPPPAAPHERHRLRTLHEGVTANSFEPSVVGITANMATNPHMFVGDYFYQEMRQEQVDVKQLQERITWILNQLARHRPAAARPKQIVIFRDGVSEGEYDMCVKNELKAIRDGCLRHASNYRPKFLFVVATKGHHKRFMAFGANGAVENLTPGSVIANGVATGTHPEFYMQTQYPIKGVGKSMQYTVLNPCDADFLDVTQDQLQALIHVLCFSHQIVNCSVSKPEPIYQAHELAKRGWNNYKTLKTNFQNQVPILPSGLVNYQRLTDELCYMNSPLVATRFTA